MPPQRKMIQTLESSANSSSHFDDARTQVPKISPYELSREERIKENLQKMQSLGIMDISLKLKTQAPTRRTQKKVYSGQKSSSDASLVLSSGPLRRSSRLQNVTPVSYSEVVLAKKDKSLEDSVVRLEEGSKPEVYTEEHEKLLGNTERSWTFFVDGYGKDGRRIYDPVRGKTCHQCRQKTLGYRTHCSKCNLVQGQFCGDCLYMRYGENVLEAMENPNWVCPVCRGICNCSLCRTSKGWLPTGPIYRKVSSLGFRSVAHYLIQTRRLQTNLEKNQDTANQVKRSLSFSAAEKPLDVNDNPHKTSGPQAEDVQDNDCKCEEESEAVSNRATNNQNSVRRSLPFSVTEYTQAESKEASEVVTEVHDDHLKLSDSQAEDKSNNAMKSEKYKELTMTDKEHYSNSIAMESSSKSMRKKRRLITEPNPDSIAGRLRRRKVSVNSDEKVEEINKNVLDVRQAVKNIPSDKESEKEKNVHFTDDRNEDGKSIFAADSGPDISYRRLSQGHREDSNEMAETTENISRLSQDISLGKNNTLHQAGALTALPV